MALKEVETNAKGKEQSSRIVSSHCKKCGLKFVAEDLKDILDEDTQKAIFNLSI